MNQKEIVTHFRDIAKDYEFDPSIFCDEPERIRLVKRVINERLEDWERIVIVLYADCGSLRKLAQRFDMSHTTLAGFVRDIRAKILREYEILKDQESK